MSAVLDYIAAGIIFGILAITVGRIQININSTMYQNTFNINTQQNAVQLARQIEFDFMKIGFHVSDPAQRITAAGDSGITFESYLNNDATLYTVTYRIGSPSSATNTLNPNDFPLYRIENGTSIRQNYGLTNFSLSYFDSAFHRISTPITVSDSLKKIRAIDVKFRAESSEPVISLTDTTWISITWEKLIFPRNLNQLNF